MLILFKHLRLVRNLHKRYFHLQRMEVSDLSDFCVNLREPKRNRAAMHRQNTHNGSDATTLPIPSAVYNDSVLGIFIRQFQHALKVAEIS